MDENANYLKAVRNQYEDYPYPSRDPQDEHQRLLRTGLCELPQLNHYVHQGRMNFAGYQALVAGAGTGDATIFLATQLAEVGGQVSSLDLSLASTEVAKARAVERGLSNINWVHGSLLDLPSMELGPFDYINCCGVLHHLVDPDAGFAALKAVLKDDGGMGIMLYGTHGREGVYQMQAFLRLLNQNETDMDACVQNATLALKNLPETNWYKHSETWFADVKKFGDPGLYDLLLHSQDRAYTIPEIYEFVAKQGLNMVGFGNPVDRVKLTPEASIGDPRLLQRLARVSEQDREAVMEIFNGQLIKHSFYVSPSTHSVAQLDNLDNVPYLYGFAGEAPNRVIADGLKQARGKTVTLQDSGFNYQVTPQKHTHHILNAMDGQRTTREIFAAVRDTTGNKKLKDEVLLKDLRPVYEAFNRVDHMLLRHPSSPPLRPVSELEKSGATSTTGATGATS